MKFKFFPLFCVVFALVLSCQKKTDNSASKLAHELYDHLIEQKKYFYEVEYSEGLANQKPNFELFGTGKLTRSSYGSLSRFYFGLTPDEKNNYLQLIRNEDQAIETITSAIFDESGIDVLADSLHNAILLNPEWLKLLIEKAEKTSVTQTTSDNSIAFLFPSQNRKIVVTCSKQNNELLHLSLSRDLADKTTYVREWHFKHLNKESYESQIALHRKQLKEGQRNFL